MNPVYTILESKQRWLILAGLSFTAGCVGAMMMLAFEWKHVVVSAWLYLGLALTLVFLVRAFVDWKRDAEITIESKSAVGKRGRGTTQ